MSVFGGDGEFCDLFAVICWGFAPEWLIYLL
jgi:hypothetical protein